MMPEAPKVIDRVAILGGRFDPIHVGHLRIANEVLHMGLATAVWFSIENQHQWRPIVGSAKHRQRMAELATEDESRFQVDMTPVELGGMTETLRVMKELKRKHSDRRFVFVIGSDQLEPGSDGIPKLYKWSHWEELEKEVEFLIIARKGYPIGAIPKNAAIVEDAEYQPVDDSATAIRDLLKAGKIEEVRRRGLVPPKVLDYIIEHNLYQ